MRKRQTEQTCETRQGGTVHDQEHQQEHDGKAGRPHRVPEDDRGLLGTLSFKPAVDDPTERLIPTSLVIGLLMACSAAVPEVSSGSNTLGMLPAWIDLLRGFTVLFYNVENLFNKDDPATNDQDFLPNSDGMDGGSIPDQIGAFGGGYRHD